jgi:flavorubredoxin
VTAATTIPYAPIPPARHHEPFRIADDTWMIRQLLGEGRAPVNVYVNSMLILGKEPMIVDTGGFSNREDWVRDVKSLVDPEDVRWIFISHDDADHTGNLEVALEMCPNATLVSNWFQLERMSTDIALPLNRMRWINDGEAFEAGGRTFAAIRPPIYDSPTTRGLYDPKTGVYWGSDCFAAPVDRAIDNAGDLAPDFWREGLWQFHSLLSPWHTMLDNAKFQRQVDRIQSLDIKVAAGGHTPPITGKSIDTVFDVIRNLPNAELAKPPVQADLDAMLQAINGSGHGL